MANELTDREAEIYDRQIRLWGVEGQRRLRAARVLIAGCGALAAELAKNIILAGITVVLQDEKAVSPADLGANFLLTEEDIGKNRALAALPRAKELNTLVDVSAINRPLSTFTADDWKQYKLVILADMLPAASAKVADYLHSIGVPSITAYLSAYWGCCFVDLIKHEYTVTGEDAAKPVQVLEYPSLSTALTASPLSLGVRNPKPYTAWAACVRAMSKYDVSNAEELQSDAVCEAALAEARALSAENPAKALDEDIVRAFVSGYGVELAPVTAILGGIIGNEVVKLMTAKDEPIRNVFTFDAMGFTGGAVFKAVPS